MAPGGGKCWGNAVIVTPAAAGCASVQVVPTAFHRDTLGSPRRATGMVSSPREVPPHSTIWTECWAFRVLAHHTTRCRLHHAHGSQFGVAWLEHASLQGNRDVLPSERAELFRRARGQLCTLPTTGHPCSVQWHVHAHSDEERLGQRVPPHI